jgi:hypothetical protein
MYTYLSKTISFLIICGVCYLPNLFVYAEVSETSFNEVLSTSLTSARFNNDNWFTRAHPRIASFSVQEDGNAYGITETGISFSQYRIEDPNGIRIQRFEIEDHFHYIIEGEVVYTFQDFSKELALAYQRTILPTS